MTPVRLAPDMTSIDIAGSLLLPRASETLSTTVTTADVVDAVLQLRGMGLDASHLQIVLAGGPSDPLTERTLRERRTFYFTDGAELAAAFPGEATSDRQAVACVPLVGSAGVLGALRLLWDAPRTFDIAERAVIATLAAYVAQALERAHRLDARIGVATTPQEAVLSRLPACARTSSTATNPRPPCSAGWTRPTTPSANRPSRPPSSPSSTPSPVADTACAGPTPAIHRRWSSTRTGPCSCSPATTCCSAHAASHHGTRGRCR